MLTIRRKRNKGVPGLDTTATSDISFMLLIFFLVTTSMESEKGLGRQLPPPSRDPMELATEVDKEHVMTLELLEDGKVRVDENETPRKADDALRKDIRRFIMEKGKTHIIELHVSRDAEYEAYFRLQNHIVRAYSEIREAAAQKKYGVPFSQCTMEMRDELNEMFPQRVMEGTLTNH